MLQAVSRAHRNITLCAALLLPVATMGATRTVTAQNALRPPSVPLVAHDPYFSIWSNTDTLTASATRHWTGREHSLSSLIRIDGTTYRLMGNEPADAPALPQTAVNVLPTRTIYHFQNQQVRVMLTFTTPALPDNLDILARPVTYLTWDVQALNGRHRVQIYSDAGAELTVNDPKQRVTWDRQTVGDLAALRVGSEEQKVLGKRGDDLRIDWGYLYLAAPRRESQSALAERAACQKAFMQGGALPQADDTRKPRAANDARPVAAFAFNLGRVSRNTVSRRLMLAYDDEYSIMLMRHRLRPYWRRSGATAAQLLQTAARDYPWLQQRCAAFDAELMTDLRRRGGEKFARLAALAHRQALAAQKVVADANGQPLSFSKENASNGCIATVDVIYPAAPQLLLLSPTLMKASLVPVLNYAASPRWKFPFAPHDMGTYPAANGQVYGGGERTEENQMPVEESGNMLIMLAALAKYEGNANFSSPFWPQIKQWARYLEEKGFDPENQLSTDDFAGHLAHNVNLSAKAIEALGAYSVLCQMRGDTAEATRVRTLTRDMAARWVTEAAEGDHFRLAFDRPNTWSQKYNLVWDSILGLNLFPASVFTKETAFYRTKLNRYGLPLDNRKTYTKLDWIVWTATMSPTRADFEAIVGPAHDFLHETPSRVPMTDWYDTISGRHVGFQARSVVGGVFIPLLTDAAVWKKWASRDANRDANWAPLPAPPQITEVVPTSQKTPVTWRYTFERPADKWFTPDFEDAGWKSGPGGFGTEGTPGAVIGTRWNTSDIWLRRDFTLPANVPDNLQLLLHHDEDAEIYINGVLAAKVGGFTGDYDVTPLTAAGRAALRPGKNTIAMHVHQSTGGQFIDVGLATVKGATQ